MISQIFMDFDFPGKKTAKNNGFSGVDVIT